MIYAIRDLYQELLSDLKGPKLVPALSAGFTSGLSLLVAQTAFGTLIFSGVLAPYSSQGIGLILFGNFAACLLLGLTGGFRGTIAGLSPALVIVMVTIVASVNTNEEALFVTVYGLLALSAVITGLCCLLIGRYNLAILLRFIPYPVASGFVTGLGATVCLAAMSMMGIKFSWDEWSSHLEPDRFMVWMPGLIYGIGLYFAIRQWRKPLILTASVVFLIVGYNLSLALMDISITEAGTRGILAVSTATGSLWPPLDHLSFNLVDWSVLIGQIPNILTLILIAFVCIIMNIAGLELAVDQELDWDTEFNSNGLTTLIAGIGGGTVATIIVPSSMRSKLLGASTRWTSVIAALVLAAALVFGGSMLAYIPIALIGGIVFFAGLGLLEQGFQGVRKGLPRSEFGIVILIFFSILFFGLVEGVAVGILAALVFFVVRLSRVDPVEAQDNLLKQRSSKSRPVPELIILQEEGDCGIIYQLRGYIFFGSISPLTERLKETFSNPRPPQCMVLDFSAITGFDFSAVNSLSMFLRLAREKGIAVALSTTPARLISLLERNLAASTFSELEFKENLDLAVEYCEDTLITSWRTKAATEDDHLTNLLEKSTEGLVHQLDQQVEFERLIEELQNLLESREYKQDEDLTPATPEKDIQLLVKGKATVRDASGGRLNQFEPGDLILTMQGHGKPAVKVVAEMPCLVKVLTSTARRILEQKEPELALRFYRYVLARNFDTLENK